MVIARAQVAGAAGATSGPNLFLRHQLQTWRWQKLSRVASRSGQSFRRTQRIRKAFSPRLGRWTRTAWSTAAVYARRAVDGFEALYGRDHDQTLSALNNLASILRAQGNLAEAERWYAVLSVCMSCPLPLRLAHVACYMLATVSLFVLRQFHTWIRNAIRE